MSFPSYMYLAYTSLNKAFYQNARLSDCIISMTNSGFTEAFYNDCHNKLTFKGAYVLSVEVFYSKASCAVTDQLKEVWGPPHRCHNPKEAAIYSVACS